MDVGEARVVLRTFAGGGTPVGLRTACATVSAYLDDLERRAAQVEGGHYLRYGRPDEVARWILTGDRHPKTESE